MFRHRILPAAALAAAFLAAGASHAQAPTQRGTTVTSPLTVGQFQVALPPGEWRVVNEHNGTSMMAAGPLHWRGLELAQFDAQGRMVATHYVRGSTEPSAVRHWTDLVCGRTEVLYADPTASTETHPQCVIVAHLTEFWRKEPLQSFDKATWQSYQDSRMQLPFTAICVHVRLYREGDFLVSSTCLNPERSGLVSKEADPARSEWHRDNVARDPQRQAYAERVKGWAVETLRIGRETLEKKKAGVPTLPALPQ